MNDGLKTEESDQVIVSSGHQSPAHVVAIGASAGGLEALQLFFSKMESNSGMAFVVLQHLSPDYKSLMGELLSKHTDMQVLKAETGVEIQANTVYLLPPKMNLSIRDSRLVLAEQDHRASHVVNFPIDTFFNSLALDQRDRAVCVVLSGTGSDGTRGVRSIKESGGMVMVQDPGTAKFDGMPRSAIATGLADYILSPDKMPEQLLAYVKHPMARAKTAIDNRPATSPSDLGQILELVRQHSSLDFNLYKPSTVVRRIERRMGINQINSIEEYADFVQNNPREVHVLYRELLIGVTKFFRDPEAFDILENDVIPQLFERAKEHGSIRVWVAACSTGEEAYSLAVLLLEAAERLGQSKTEIRIFGTDVDRDAIEYAGNGIYPESIAADVSSERLSRFFQRRGDSFQVQRRLRETVVFAQHNLLKDPPFTKIDLVSCRNLLIYIQPQVQRRILSLMHFALHPDGFLFQGSSETIGDLTDHFAAVNSKWKIFRCRGGARLPASTSLALPSLSDRMRAPTDGFRRGQPARDQTVTRLNTELIRQFVPDCVVIDERHQIIHTYGDVGRWLRVPGGPFTSDLLAMVTRDMSIALATAIRKATRDAQPVVYHDIRCQVDGQDELVSLRVQPIKDNDNQLCFVFFEPSRREPEQEAETVEEFRMDQKAAQRINDLEQELQHTRENLQATIEELETSNEELQATNKELLAANEELQSTNEELHSVNEELYTVNAEFQAKIGELTDLNNDLDNLLSSLDVGTLFLDLDLRIRKFNEAVEDWIHITPHDIGRPVEHLKLKMSLPGFMRELRTVIDENYPVQIGGRSDSGRTLMIRLVPYRVDKEKVAGVTVIVIDVSGRLDLMAHGRAADYVPARPTLRSEASRDSEASEQDK